MSENNDVKVPPMSVVIQQLQVDIEKELFDPEAEENKGDNLIANYIAWKQKNGGFEEEEDDQFTSSPTVHLGGDGGPQKGDFKKGSHRK